MRAVAQSRHLAPLLCSALSLLGCANGVDGRDKLLEVDAAIVGQADAVVPLDKPDARPLTPVVASSCPALQFATGLDGEGKLLCAPIDTVSKTVLNQQCTLFSGWRDSCDGCVEDPSKWGQVQSGACANGAGAGNTCTVATLGAASVNLFGLDTDGDVGDDDKFYVGFRCEIAEDLPVGTEALCESGSYLSALRQTGPECLTGHGAISTYASTSCHIYLGARDNCDGCTTGPAKAGRARTVGCTNLGGTNNTCINTSIAGGLLDLFGLNTDGDVNGDDKFHVGYQCTGAVAESSTVAEVCADGQLVTAILEDGSIECTSVAPAAEAAIQSDCYVYYGWRDNCDGCTTPPAKWGRVSYAGCENGLGADNTCNTHDLGGVLVTMFGLSTDGDVNGDDKFYMGFQCE